MSKIGQLVSMDFLRCMCHNVFFIIIVGRCCSLSWHALLMDPQCTEPLLSSVMAIVSEAVEVQCLPADIYQLYAECLGMTVTSVCFESHTLMVPKRAKRYRDCDMSHILRPRHDFLVCVYPEEMGMMATLQRQLDKDETILIVRFCSEVCHAEWTNTTTVAFSEMFHDVAFSGAGGCWSLKRNDGRPPMKLKGPALGTAPHLT